MRKKGSKKRAVASGEKTPNPSPLKPPWQPGQSGNPRGRPKSSRHRLSEDFLKALADDFAVHGVAVISKVRAKQPAKYLELIGKLQPKEIDLNAAAPLADWTLDEVVTVLERMREEVRTSVPGGRMN